VDLGVRYARLHVAGNDALFALKALLMLAVRDGRKTPEPKITVEKEEEERLFSHIRYSACAVWNSDVMDS
jgi:hypothetical protein